ncbi:hypothetical protein AB0F15_12600 [Amycolatopsis sp. NPDC026612]|uniref:hypothetical protein n=1 Tax=Amycolatopsis sp. NPDC026612 TaxID=3155466 RepID=UPI0034072A18
MARLCRDGRPVAGHPAGGLEPAGDGLRDRREGSYLWGYGHYGIFAALAVLGASLEVVVAGIAAACALLVAFTITREGSGNPA